MKKNSLLIVIIIACASLHVTSSCDNENQSWLSAWWSKLNPFNYIKKDAALLNKWGLTSENFEELIFNNNENNNTLNTTDAFSAFLIDKKLTQVGIGNNNAAQQKIKQYLNVSINDEIVNPTAKTKINTLASKEGFLGHITDNDTLLESSCKALIEEIAARTCSPTQKIKADKIDKIIDRIKKNLKSRQSMHEQVTEIEKSEGFLFAKAYISVYLKLQHQITMEQLFGKK
jgi:hypothetical protein